MGWSLCILRRMWRRSRNVGDCEDVGNCGNVGNRALRHCEELRGFLEWGDVASPWGLALWYSVSNC